MPVMIHRAVWRKKAFDERKSEGHGRDVAQASSPRKSPHQQPQHLPRKRCANMVGLALKLRTMWAAVGLWSPGNPPQSAARCWATG